MKKGWKRWKIASCLCVVICPTDVDDGNEIYKARDGERESLFS